MPGSFNIHKDTSTTQYLGMTARKSLRKHAYSSKKKISPPRTENFQIKTDIFHISAKKYSCFSLPTLLPHCKIVYDVFFFGIQGGRRLRKRVVSTR